MSSKNATELAQLTDKDQSFLPAIPINRSHQLEVRLSNQERTIAVLLEQAFRIKEDITSCLRGSQGFHREESLTRKLLENHIQTITSIVKKLNQNMEILQEQIRARDGVTTETNLALQNLNQKLIQEVGDLRGRVARCDANIAKLSGDLNVIRHDFRGLEKEVQEIKSTLEAYSNKVELKVMQLLGKIEISTSEQTSNLKTIYGDHHHELQLLDFKVNKLLGELCEQIQKERKWTESQFTKSENEQFFHINQLLITVRNSLEEAENKMEEKMNQQQLKIENLTNPQKYEAELNQMKNAKNTLFARINRMEKQMWEELEKIQDDYKSGFQLVHESLESLQQIQTSKMRLEKKRFKKDINKLQRKITEAKGA
ncbi:protein FAM81B isoform X1 [Ornithorhynchus anatinus]|uniref:Family with sequence similarity 81 member B n=1 Tax=Ornithorhynchus anatinus TaxID=9258 RepID=F7FKN2_ORNAN|nr:protein FAM81B isoform X1 [Ornithorhynchus anatinus]